MRPVAYGEFEGEIKMAIDREIADKLGLIGLSQDSRALSVLSVILRLTEENSEPVTAGQIHEAISQEQTDTEVTKTWIHRVVKTLTEMKLIRSETEQAYRKRYLTDLGTIVSGLEFLKSQTIEGVMREQKELHSKIQLIESCEPEELGIQLVEGITGSKQRMSSRFIRGLTEFHRVTNFSIYQVAKKGDIIRNCMLWVEPFLTADLGERIQRLVVAAERGVEIRYFVTDEFQSADSAVFQSMEPEKLQQFVVQFLSLLKTGKKIDFRVYTGPKNTYQFASLNQDRIAFFLTYDPLTAVYFTRDFNPDLINNSVSTFDKYWDDAPSFFEWIANHAETEEGGDFAKLVASVMKE